MKESDYKKTIREALNHMDSLIVNPNEVIQIKPSFEYEYLMNILKEQDRLLIGGKDDKWKILWIRFTNYRGKDR